jgi:hypothetical protein
MTSKQKNVPRAGVEVENLSKDMNNLQVSSPIKTPLTLVKTVPPAISVTSLQENIKKTILEFIADIKDNIFTDTTEQGDLLLVEFFFNKMDVQSVTNKIVDHLLPHAEMIKRRDINFFINKKKEIFAGLPEDRVNHLVRLIDPENDKLSEEDREVIWAYFDTLLSLAEEYKKRK